MGVQTTIPPSGTSPVFGTPGASDAAQARPVQGSDQFSPPVSVPPQGQPAPSSQFQQQPQQPISQPSAQPAPGVQSFRDVANQQFGLDLSHLPDDRSALQYLITEAVQGRQYADAANRYMQHAGDFEQWLAQRQQQNNQQQQNQQKGWWNPPEWRPEWNQYIQTNPQTGQPVLKPGSDPSILGKYLAYQNHRQQWADRLLDNPEEALAPLIDKFATQRANQMVQEHLGGYQDRVWADQYVAQNSSWLHQRDQNGNLLTVVDPRTGQSAPRLSPLGEQFRQYVIYAHKQGVGSLQAQQEFARALLERNILANYYQQSQANQNGRQQDQQLVQNQFNPNAAQATYQPNFSGTFPNQAPNASGMPQNPTMNSFRDMLTEAFKVNGITDNDILTSPRA